MTENNRRLREILGSFVPVRLSSVSSGLAQPDEEQPVLSETVRRALPHLMQAFDALHEIFLLQQSEEQAERIRRKKGESGTLAEFYRRFEGPWYPVENFRSCDPEVPDRDPRCSYYPHDMSAEEFYGVLETLSEEDRKEMESPTTLIRRDEDGKLVSVAYHAAYAEHLAEVFDGLERAADILESGGAGLASGDGPAGSGPEEGERKLADYLRTRAEALVTGSCIEADSAWLRLNDAPLEVVIGPYEVYSDGLLGRKAMYEGMLLAVDRERGGRLKEVEEHLETLAEHFPLPAGAKPAVGGMAPMVVVHEIYNAGEARQPVYPAAFNLPNDPWVRGHVGWKQVMIYNVMKAKFANATVPIARRVLADAASVGQGQGQSQGQSRNQGKSRNQGQSRNQGAEELDFEPYFYRVLLHEVSHGLGPAYRADGRSVDSCLGPHYTPIEEAKADAGGLYLLLEYGGTAGIPAFDEGKILRGHTAALFRSMRFGVHEAHGAANVIQHNWMLEHGLIERGADGYRVHPGKVRNVFYTLLEELCRLQAEADEEEAKAFLERWAQPDAGLAETVEGLRDLPVDLFLEIV